MDALEFLKLGTSVIASPSIIMYILAGVVLGAVFGCIPGLNGTLAMLLILPLVFPLPVTEGISMLAGTFCGACVGGAFSSILLNIPGTAEAVCTTFDGYPMAQQGMAKKAVQASVISSGTGGFVSALAFIFMAPTLASVALKFSDADYFGVIVMGVLVIGVISGKSLINGFTSGTLGFLLGTVGIASPSAESRFTFDVLTLDAGIKFVIVMIGVFGLGEVFSSLGEIKNKKKKAVPKNLASDTSGFTLKEFWEQKYNFIRSSILGIIAGVVPGIGATLGSFLAYGTVKALSKNPDDFGKGKLAGIVAPETANNGATGGSMIPLFALGIPGGSAAAVMLAVLLFKGLQPGPMIFMTQPKMIGSIMFSLLIANLFVLLIGRYGAVLFVSILKVNYAYIVTAVCVFCLIGSYSFRNILLDVHVVLIAGIFGYYCKKRDFPVAPFVLALVLGPMAEYRFINALGQNNNSIFAVLTSPIGMGALIFGCFFMVPSIIGALKKTINKQSLGVRVSISLVSPLLLLGLMAVCVYLWSLTYAWPIHGKPGSWPRIILGTLIILSLMSLLKWFLVMKQAKGNIEWTSVRDYFIPDGMYIFIPMSIFTLYILLLPYVGFILLTVPFCIVMLYTTGIRSVINITVFTVTITFIISFVFIGCLKCSYPTGIGYFGDFHNWFFAMLY